MKLSILLVIAIYSLASFGADTAKPPAIDSSKFWRLIARAQNLRIQANQTPQAKAADVADEAVKKEQERLQGACGEKFVLGYQQDEKSPRYQDIDCLPKLEAPPTVNGKANEGKK